MKKVLTYLLFATLIFSVLLDQTTSAQDPLSELSQHHRLNGWIPCNDADLYLEMASEGLEAKQYRQVVRLCECVLQRDSVNKEAHFLLGIAHHYLGEHDLAVEELHWVLLLDKDNAVAKEYLEKSKRKSISQWSPQEARLIKTAFQYHEEGLNGLAISALKEALKQNSKNTEAWELLGDIYGRLGNLTTAKAAYYRANAQKKFKQINGETKDIPNEWWKNLSEKEAKLREANLQFAEIREQTIQMGGRLDRLSTSIEDKISSEKHKLYELENELGKLEEERRQLQERDGETIVVSEMKAVAATTGIYLRENTVGVRVDRTKQLEDNKEKLEKIKAQLEKTEGELPILLKQYGEEHSKMKKELEGLNEKLSEIKSSMRSLEEGLKYDPLQ